MAGNQPSLTAQIHQRPTAGGNYIIGGNPHTPAGPTGDQLSGFEGITTDFLSRQPSNLNPLLPTYFQFSLKRCPHVSFFCQSANLPGVSISVVEQPTRFRSIPHTPSTMEYEDLSINFLVDEEMKNWLEMYDWMRSTLTRKDHEEIKDTPDHYADASLSILNSAMKPQVRIEFFNMLPTELSALEFDSTVSTPEPLISTASFRYTTYEITRLSS